MARRQGEGRIETCGWSWNPVRGRCGFAQEGNACEYCWEEIFYKRFGGGKKPINQTLRLDEKELNWCPREPARIAVCYSTDLFHYLVDMTWTDKIMEKVRAHPQNIYQFLTKAPWMTRGIDFPDNAWLGTTVDGTERTDRNAGYLAHYEIDAQTKYLFFEPLIEFPIDLVEKDWTPFAWIVIGADSRKGAKKPPVEWAERLIEHARKFAIAVFVKDNYPGFMFPPKEFPDDRI